MNVRSKLPIQFERIVGGTAQQHPCDKIRADKIVKEGGCCVHV